LPDTQDNGHEEKVSLPVELTRRRNRRGGVRCRAHLDRTRSDNEYVIRHRRKFFNAIDAWYVGGTRDIAATRQLDELHTHGARFFELLEFHMVGDDSDRH
jgi:hypothetical protein